MRNKFFCLTFFFIFTTITSFAGTTIIHYKSNQWCDVKKNGLEYAMNNPINENVDIFKTEKFIKVNLGKSSFNYKIISSKKFSDHRMDYNVTLNGKKYLLSICISMATQENGDFSYFIGIDGLWIVPNVSDVSNNN
jgi:hypothetical protein